MNSPTVLNNFLSYSEETFHIGGLTIITLLIVVGTFFLACFCIFCPSILLKDNDRRYGRCDKDNLHLTGNGKRGLLSLMFAKLDEFDSLTPLILSPEGSNNNNSLATAITEQGILMDDNSLKNNNNLLQKIVSSPAALRNILSRSCSGSSVSFKNSTSTQSSDDNKINMAPEEVKQAMVAEFLTTHTSSNSPPPIKRATYGETLIAPLTNFNKNVMLKIQSSNNIILTPESRITTFDYTTSKSCATIPEDDEEGESIYGDDLVSIDRTVISNTNNQMNYYKYTNKYNLSMYGSIPRPYNGQPPLSSPPPSYPPPTPPDKKKLDLEKIIKPESPTKKSGISNLSTPNSSIGGSNSIVDDTCSSVSEESFIEHEEVCENNPLDGTYQLHRIDEVSESLTTGSKTIDSIATMESYTNSNFINPPPTGFKMARSVSEQFELGFSSRKIDN
uniref:Wsv299 n=1 Tax=Strongyloides stercoralis TaxID=6248 RepID=A0A0K0E8Y6_STRER